VDPSSQDLTEDTASAASMPDGSATPSAEWSMRHTPIRQLMSTNVRCVGANASVRETAQVMQASECACVVVVEHDVPVGIVTERDMIRILTEILALYPVDYFYIRDFMSTPPICLNENICLYEALVLAQSKNFDRIPVVDASRRVVGLVSRETLADAHLAAVEQERDAIEQQVYSRSRALSESNRKLQALALQDSLLRVGNRRAMEMDVQSSHLNAIRYGHSYALALIDVDWFKRYNDHYGHCAGDKALIAVANCVKDSIRRGDRVYRYGGEELLVLMPETSQREAMEAVSRITSALFQLNIEHSKSPLHRLTISAGVSAFTGAGTGVRGSWESVLEEADTFLYQAKALGRNQAHGLLEDSLAR
jgi:diguanylate cyclase (GGDEF)-like protein